MAIPFFIEKRVLIPNWRSFKTTVALGELSTTQENKELVEDADLLIDKINQWRDNQNIIHAIEVLNSAIVLNYSSFDEIREAAEFIINRPRSVSKSMLSLAHKYAGEVLPDNPFNLNVLDAYEEFEAIEKRQKLFHKIHSIREKLKKFPRNPMLWVELSRYYSIIGQMEQAKTAIRIANDLAPENRFVLRSLTRLFTHSHDYDIAHDHLRKSDIVKFDPWITSAEIAVACLRDRQSKFVGKAKEMISSTKFSLFSLTELLSGIATLELENGSIKKSRNLFRQSLISPNANSIAQAEWAVQEEKKLDLIIPKDLYSISAEALAYECYDKSDWRGVIENCLKWFVEVPQSQSSMLLAFHVATIFLKDYEKGIRFCNAGLISHPNDPTILNNRAYALAMLQRLDEATEDIKRAESDPNVSGLEKVCLKATRGLIYYRRNEISEARDLYVEAMADAKKCDEPYYVKMAFLNFAREELLLKSPESEVIIAKLEKLKIDDSYKDLAFMRSELLRTKYKKDATTLFPVGNFKL